MMARGSLGLLALLFLFPAVGRAQDEPGLSGRLRDAENRVGELRAAIGASHARLSLLSPEHGAGRVARVHVTHRDETRSVFRLVRVVFALDGAQIFQRTDAGGIDDEVLDVFDGAMPPGAHVLSVELEYRGDGLGVFSYVDHYRYRVTSSHGFSAEAGEALDLEVITYEPGGPLTPSSEALDLRYAEEREPVAR